jgi:hypothetical protein
MAHWLSPYLGLLVGLFSFLLRQNGPPASSGKQEAKHHDGGNKLLHG